MTILLGHFTRVESDGTWLGVGYPPAASDWQGLDQRAAQAVNGDDGGCWAPQTPIVINGLGLNVTGPTLVLGQGTMTSSFAGAWTLFATQLSVPQLGPTHAGRNRVIVTSCNEGRAALPFGAVSFQYGLQATAQAFAFLDSFGNVVSQVPNLLYVPLRVHHGATLTSVIVSFAVTQAHAPAQVPLFRIVRVDAYGSQFPMTSTAAGGGVGGYVGPTVPSSASGWYAGGAAQLLAITCDQNNVIDTTQYIYFLEIIEEQGQTGYPSVLQVPLPASLATVGAPPVAVTGAVSAGGLIKITVASAAGWLTTGERVTIAGVVGTTEANGNWTITSVDATDFTLNGSTFTNAYVSGGTVTAPQPSTAASTTNIIDGVAANTVGEIVLIKDATNTTNNGLWAVQSGYWTRATLPLSVGMIVPVALGNLNSGTYWQLQTSPPYTLSTYTNWPPSTAVVLGQIVAPTAASASGFAFQCTTAGTTGSTEPTWPSAAGAQVTDSGAVWTAIANPASHLSFAGGPVGGASTLIPSSGGTFVAQGTLFLQAAAVFANITSQAFQ